MTSDLFHPIVQQWFIEKFGEPTDPQRQGWPSIAAGQNTLIAAPTGSGKTLSAFLVCIDRLFRRWLAGELQDGVSVVYVSPLKALSNDIHRNLQSPLEEISLLAFEQGIAVPPIRAMVRTGDTPASERQQMLRNPPHILVTTPESLYLLLTAKKSRELLRGVETVIVDEIHALARDKRGSHLTLTLERLAALTNKPPVRIGLSATQKPIEQIAGFLCGEGPVGPTGPVAGTNEPQVERHAASSEIAERYEPQVQSGGPDLPCTIVNVGHARELDLALEVPPSELEAVCSHEQWAEIYDRLVELVNQHRSTLIFVNTRKLAERIAFNLTELLGEEAVASHHGSLSKDLRLNAERRLKSGQLKAIVATASLEMGIDVGYIDLVCQIGSPRAIATFLQRVGRSGHHLRATPKGRMFSLTRDELLECLALVRAVRQGKLDEIEIPVAPLDILAQQVIAATACEECTEDELFDLARRAWPYRDLARKDFDNIIRIVSEGIAKGNYKGRYVHRDAINGKLNGRRGARMTAITSGGAIPETAEYRVVTEDEGTYVGKLDEDFAIESNAGDIFLLGNTSWRVHYVRGGEVVVSDAHGAPPSIPFWFGEAPGRTIELSQEVSDLRRDLATEIAGGERPAEWRKLPACETQEKNRQAGSVPHDDPLQWLQTDCGAPKFAAEQAIRYVQAQQAAMGLVPTCDQIVYERFFDESGGMQLVIHAPLGGRINRAWGLALRKRFCRSFDFELQAAADDNGVVLSMGPQHSFAIEDLMKMLTTQNGEYLLTQALLAAPMFQVRWRWNASRALAVLRFAGGKKIPPHLQRYRSDDLLSAVFPQTTGCLENHHGDIEIPDHPIVQQTVYDCLHEAMDLDRWLGVLGDVEGGKVKLVGRDTREPSPFAAELINSNPYTFLDGAPLEERRTRAITTRRGLNIEATRDLAKLDPAAIEQVVREAWPLVRNANELHDALMSFGVLPAAEGQPWQRWFDELVESGRAAIVGPVGPTGPAAGTDEPPATDSLASSNEAASDNQPQVQSGGPDLLFWIAAEQLPLVEAAYGEVTCQPSISLPKHLHREVERAAAWVELVRGQILFCGPTTAEEIATKLCLETSQVEAALSALESEGTVLQGSWTEVPNPKSEIPNQKSQWCDRRLLARIHRLTIAGLRKRIQPVEPPDYLRFLLAWHGIGSDNQLGGATAVREAVALLEGFQMPAAVWEKAALPARVADYDPRWLDELFQSGELCWGRLSPPGKPNKGRAAGMRRTAPMSIQTRGNLPWLLPLSRDLPEDNLSGDAREILQALRTRGALFLQELTALTEMLNAQLEDGLCELASIGWATADTFAAVRAIVDRRKRTRSSFRRPRRLASTTFAAGRWSLFPGIVQPPEEAKWVELWCHKLLSRWGVVFRDLVARESAAPPWWQLVNMYRTLERRGEIRGGRFIRGVSGEQFASERAVEQLRTARESTEGDTRLHILCAADPLNLAGLIDNTPRVPATHRNFLAIRGGRVIAARVAGEVKFFTDLPPAQQHEVGHALRIGRAPKPEVPASGASESAETAWHDEKVRLRST